MDGTTLDTADTEENAAAFGRAGSGRREAVFPQLRMVALAESGTGAIFAAAMGAFGTGEQTLARQLLDGLGPGMLVPADRGFAGQPLFAAMVATGAELCWRTEAGEPLPVLERYPDGSYRSELVAHADRRARTKVCPVRVVEYKIEDAGRPQAEDLTYRLVTTIMDPVRAPAAELAALYAQRWEFESALDELTTHQSSARTVMRSKTLDGLYQEAWGMLCVHYAIRALLCRAAYHGDIDPDQGSFTRTLRAEWRSVRRAAGEGVSLAQGLLQAIGEILSELLPPRRLRANSRVVREKMSNYRVKRPEHRRWPQPTRPACDAIRILSPP